VPVPVFVLDEKNGRSFDLITKCFRKAYEPNMAGDRQVADRPFGSIAFPLIDIGQKSEKVRILEQTLLSGTATCCGYKLTPRTRKAIPFGNLNWTTEFISFISKVKQGTMARQYLKERAGLSGQKTSPSIDIPTVVREVIETIRKDGDKAVRKYSEKFDRWSPENFKLSQSDIDTAMANCSRQTIDDIKEVQQNVRLFAEAQKASLKDFEVEIKPGVHLGQKNVPIDNVGW
jgi:hypothetical protein